MTVDDYFVGRFGLLMRITDLADLLGRSPDGVRVVHLAMKSKDGRHLTELEGKQKAIQEELDETRSKIYEQEKLSSHSVLIKVSESRIMILIKNSRNSVMYL